MALGLVHAIGVQRLGMSSPLGDSVPIRLDQVNGAQWDVLNRSVGSIVLPSDAP